MRNLLLRRMSLRLLVVACFAGLFLTPAHEGHHAECNDTTINAVKS